MSWFKKKWDKIGVGIWTVILYMISVSFILVVGKNKKQEKITKWNQLYTFLLNIGPSYSEWPVAKANLETAKLTSFPINVNTSSSIPTTQIECPNGKRQWSQPTNKTKRQYRPHLKIPSFIESQL